MTRDQVRYFERRAEEESRRATEASDIVVREIHKQIAEAYSYRVAQAKAVYATIEKLLG